MKIISLELYGIIPVNAYICYDEKTMCGVIIDPGAEVERILSALKKENIKIEKILLTHGHFDHIGAALALSEAVGAPICMGEGGAEYAKNPQANLSTSTGREIVLPHVTELKAGEIVPLENAPTVKLSVISTPGHTADGTTYYATDYKVAFVGDTIFAGSYGRTDFYGGDENILLTSIKEKILALPEGTVLLSGHSEPTTVAAEKARPWYR